MELLQNGLKLLSQQGSLVLTPSIVCPPHPIHTLLLALPKQIALLVLHLVLRLKVVLSQQVRLTSPHAVHLVLRTAKLPVQYCPLQQGGASW